MSTGERISAAPEVISCDLADFEAAFQTGMLRDAQQFLEKGFFQGFDGPCSRGLSEWIDRRTAEIHEKLRKSGIRAWMEHENRAEWAQAKEVAEMLLRLEPLEEDHLRRVMEACAKAGTPQESDVAFKDFSLRMKEERSIQWEPSKGTRDLFARIQTHAADPHPWGQHPESEPHPQPPLCGRREELGLLRRTLRRVPHQDLRVILVTGEGGIGKSRLIREALVGLPVEGQRIFYAEQADLERIIPLNPLIEAFGTPAVAEVLETLDEPWRTVLYGAMPSHFPGAGPIPDPPQIRPGSVPRRLFEALYQLLTAIVGDGPIILALEGLQWADDTTLSILEFLTRKWDSGGLQLIISVRSEERVKNSCLSKLLETVQTHEDFLAIPLEELSPSSSHELIQALSPRTLSEGEITRLFALAGGNPLFLAELTLELLAGRLESPTVVEDHLSIPLSIRQILRRRLGQLSTEAERILGALAVYRRPIDIRGIGRIARLSVDSCLVGLDALHAFRLVERETAGVRIPHELIRHTVYQDLSESRRAWLHERVAHHLQRTRQRPPVNELAFHYNQAGSTVEARQYATEAAAQAEASGAIPEALRFLRIARDRTDDPEQATELIGKMGHLNYLHRNLQEAAPLLEVASQRFRRQGEVSKALEFELERIDSLAHTDLLPFRECLEELKRVKSEARDAGEWDVFAKALDVEAHHLDHQGDIEGVRRVLQEAERFKNLGGPRARCQTRATLALNIYYGTADRALAAAREAVPIATMAAETDLQLMALNRLIMVLLFQGELGGKEGKRAINQAEMGLSTSGDLNLKFFVRLNQALWHLEVGEIDQADVSFRVAGIVIRGTNATTAHTNLALNKGELALSQHDFREAKENYIKAESLLRQSSPRSYKTTINAGLGLCALHEGDLATARRREEALPEMEGPWAFDPTVAVWFKARMMDRRGNRLGGAALIHRVGESIRDRFVTSWLKLMERQARTLRRFDPETSVARAKEALRVAQELGLDTRVTQFKELLRGNSSE
ncbi:AAA family ATPase [Gemmatimonadota bacterium]